MADASVSDVTVIQVSPTPTRARLDVGNELDHQRAPSPGEPPLSPASHDETTALIERVHDMLDTRPACMAGRRGSASSRSFSSRNTSGRQTLPTRSRPTTSSSVRRFRRTVSLQLHDYTQAGNLVVEDVERVTDEEPAPTVEIVTEFNRGETSRQSTNHLRQRVQER